MNVYMFEITQYFLCLAEAYHTSLKINPSANKEPYILHFFEEAAVYHFGAKSHRFLVTVIGYSW